MTNSIDMTTVKLDDKLHTRGGDVLVARRATHYSTNRLLIGSENIEIWREDGSYGPNCDLDITRIERAPEVWENISFAALFKNVKIWVSGESIDQVKYEHPNADKYLRIITRSSGKHSIEEV